MRRSAFTQIAAQIALATCALASSTVSLADDPAPPRPKPDSSDILMVNWFDHLSFGTVNTLVGGAVLTGTVISKKLKGKPIRLRLDHSRKNIVLEDAGNPASSLGPFHFGWSERYLNLLDNTKTDHHESGHGLQSGVLGPSLGTLVGIMALRFKSHDDTDGHLIDPVENWSSAWGYYLTPSLVNSTSASLSVGVDTQGGTVKRASTTLLERASRLETLGADRHHLGLRNPESIPYVAYKGTPEGNPHYAIQVLYRYGNLGAQVDEGCAHEPVSLTLEAGLFQKDFLAEWKGVLPALTLLIDSKQEVGAFEIEVVKKTVDAKLLKHVLGYGLRLGSRDTVAVDAIGRGGYGVSGRWGGEGAPGFYGFLGAGYEGRLHLLDQAQLSYRVDREWGRDGYRLKRDSLSLGTPKDFQFRTFTGIDGKSGAPRALWGEIEYAREDREWSTGTEPKKVRVLLFTLGGRI